ncbi:MAG: hypothetical protein J6O39_08145 [Treponema sp.]|nr:hypothetical protein [Treponema sp.]
MSWFKKYSFLLFFLIVAVNIASSAPKKNTARDLFKSYPQRFQEIHSAALTDALAADFSSAISQFTKTEKNKTDVFGILQSEASEVSVKAAAPYIEKIKSLIKDYEALQSNLQIQKEVSGDYNITDLTEKLKKISSVRNQVYEAGISVSKIDSSVYIRHLSASINGVPEAEYSGICGVMDCQFDYILKSALNPLEKKALDCARNIKHNFSSENIFTQFDSEKVTDAVSKLNVHIEQCKRLNSLSSLIKKSETEYEKQMNMTEQLLSDVNLLSEIIQKIKASLNLTVKKPEDIKLSLRTRNDAYSDTLVKNAEALFTYGKTVSSIKSSQDLITLKNLNGRTEFISELTDSISSACSEIERISTSGSINLWIETARYYAEAASLITSEDEGITAVLNSYINETEETKYAGKCKTECANALQSFTTDIQILSDGIKKLNAGYGYRTNFISEQRSIEESIKKISGLQEKIHTISKTAEKKYLTAKIAENSVTVLFDKAYELYKKNDFIEAFNQYQKADALYNSLEAELKNDGDLRNDLYQKLTKLKQDIINGEKPLFVIQQRKYKTDARRAYDSGNFENAFYILSQAEEKRRLWSKMMDYELESDMELERLKDFVNTAIAIKEGREISRYDSKSPEILQNLADAQMNFKKGEILFKEGKKNEAVPYLETAEEKIQLVKNFYPRNKDAGLLRLKIDQLTDKESFDATFPEKIERLKAEIKSSDISSQQAYSDLLDMYEINPAYPGLKKIITEAEYTLGYRQRPANNSQIKKASELSQQAQKALNEAGRDEILLEHARSLANQALAINSDDNTAIKVLDEIARRRGEKPAVILSAADEDLYQKALKDYRDGNLADAKIKLNRLLENKNNSLSAKIIRLKENVERKLNG